MRWSLAACLIAVGIPSAQSFEPTDPLRLVPKQADVALRIEPGKLVDAVRSLPKLAELAQFPSVREALNSTKRAPLREFHPILRKGLGRHPGRSCSKNWAVVAS